jgi:hypothetical protein
MSFAHEASGATRIAQITIRISALGRTAALPFLDTRHETVRLTLIGRHRAD